MKKVALQSIIILINLIFINTSLGQNLVKQKNYTQSDFEKCKVLDEVYHLWWYKNRWVANTTDTLPYFVDERNYKGIVNYGVTFRSKNYKTFTFIEDKSMCLLKVEFIKTNYNPKDSIINIEGFITGGWNELEKKGKFQNHIDIFLGEKKDTISYRYFEEILNINKEIIEVKWKNEEINEFTVLDTFPSFYFKNHSYYRTISKGRRPFKISGKVTKNALLGFGGRGCYSEIFDLGAMIHYPNKYKRKNGAVKKENGCKDIIIQNRLVSDIANKNSQSEENNYYKFVLNAENYILTKQYSKAKEQYNLLNQNFSTLFARDIHNAIRCAILSRDYKTAISWSEKMAFKGVELSYFNSKIFIGLRKNLEWNNFIVKYDSICKLTKSNWNLKLKNELINLLNEDQADYGLQNRKDPKKLYETTERVTDKLIDLLKREGYPSEERIGAYVKNDTILIPAPDFNVVFRHAIQQNLKNLDILNKILEKSSAVFEYDSKRSSNNIMPYNTCFHIYKGNLYKLKSCKKNDLAVKKITFKFNNPNGFIIDYGNFVTSEYNINNPKEWDDYYEQNFDFIMKLTDNWEFYDK